MHGNIDDNHPYFEYEKTITYSNYHHAKFQVLDFYKQEKNFGNMCLAIATTDHKKIGLDWASIFEKMKLTATILKGPPEEYSGVTETKIKTLKFCAEIWQTKYDDWILIEWQSFPHLCSDATEFYKRLASVPFNMLAADNNKSIPWSSQNSLVIFMFGVVEKNILSAF